MIVGVLVFVGALLFSIALHELGHLVTAKKFGMKASRYFIGMGPTVWSTRRGETEYGVKAFPIGGFVKIVGMTQLEEVDDPQDEPRAFWRFPARQRAVVLAAGSFMHFVLALVLMIGTFALIGEPKGQSTQIAQVLPCVTKATSAECAGQPVSPAQAAGFRAGDRVVAVDGKPVRSWENDFVPVIHEHKPGPVTVVVLRHGTRVTLHATVAVVVRPDPDDPTLHRPIGLLGVVAKQHYRRYGPLAAVGRAGSWFADGFTGSFKALVDIPKQLPGVLDKSGGPRDVTDGGPVGVPDLARLSGQAVEAGDIAVVLGLIAGLNLFVGIFNLLPLLPLDGGHLGILLFEKARSGIARLLRRPDPGRVDLHKLMPAMVAFIVVMVSFSLVVLYAGFANPIANPFKG